MKKRKVLAVLLCAAMTAALAVGCGGSKGSDSSDKSSDSSSSSDDVITVGFSQVGAESDWRTANSQSMKDTFSKENGYDLIFDDAQQKQENQIKAIAGIKEGKNGIELKLNDKEKALELLGRHLGMFKDKLEVTGLEAEQTKLDDLIRQMRGGG